MTSDEQSQVSRSNTTSTAGLSPIIGRFTGILPQLNERMNQQHTNQISSNSRQPHPEVETNTGGNGDSRLPSQDIPRHYRTISSESITFDQHTPRKRDVHMPDTTTSPARSPGIVKAMQFPEPSVAEITNATGTGYDGAQDEPGPNHPGLAELLVHEPDHNLHFESREAGLPSKLRSGSRGEVATVAETARLAPATFLDSRTDDSSDFGRGNSPVHDLPKLGLRTSSPAKGRVRDLATRYDGISEIARSSTPSSSIASWTGSERSFGSPTSPDRMAGNENNTTLPAPSANRPLPNAAPSFVRPHIPGSWVSYAETPSHGAAPAIGQNEAEDYDSTPIRPSAPAQNDAEIDLTPTTNKRRLPGKTFNESSGHPLDSVAAAGHAIAESLMVSMGFRDHNDDDDLEAKREAQISTSTQNTLTPVATTQGKAVDENMKQDSTSAASTIPPSPPPKDAVHQEHIPVRNEPTVNNDYFTPVPPHDTPSLQFGNMSKKDMLEPHASSRVSTGSLATADSDVEDSAEASESDRLTRDIVRSLTPAERRTARDTSPSPAFKYGKSLDFARASTLTPRDDSNWAGTPETTEFSSKRSSKQEDELREPAIRPLNANRNRDADNQRQSPVQTSRLTEPASTGLEASVASPNFLGARFSWEGTRESAGISNAVSLGRPETEESTRENLQGANGNNFELNRSPVPTNKNLKDNVSLTTPVSATYPYSNEPYTTSANDKKQVSTESPYPLHKKSHEVNDMDFAVKRDSLFNHTEQAEGSQGLGITTHSYMPNQEGHEQYISNFGSSTAPRGPAELPGQLGSNPVRASTSASFSQSSPTQNKPSDVAQTRAVTPPDSAPLAQRQNTSVTRPQIVMDASIKASQRAFSKNTPRFNTFKEFSTIKSTPQRIDAYNQTRQEYADLHTGLNEWLVQMVTANPESAQLNPTPNRSLPYTGGLASTVGLGKLQAKLMRSGTSGQADEVRSPIQEDGRPIDFSARGRQPSQQMQSKGKDRLHLGGAMSLLAKGRNKLKGSNPDKVD